MSEVVGQVMLIVGPSGVGKSNGRVQWIVKDFLADPQNGGIVTNLPLDLEAIKKYYDDLFSRGKAKCNGDDVVGRIKLIPANTLELWKKEREDPFRFMEDVEFERFRLVIDEIADYYGIHHSKEWQAKWQNFLDQARHLGDAGVELITQTVDKLPRSLKSSVEVRVDCIGCKVRRDGAFSIPFYDWYQVKAILTGEVVLSCFYVEMINVGGQFIKNGERKAYLNQESFRFYNSHGAVEGSERTGKTEVPPYKRFGTFGTLGWFLKRNAGKLVFSRGGLVVAMLCTVPFYTFGDLLIDLKNGMSPAVAKAPESEKKEAVERPQSLKSKPIQAEAMAGFNSSSRRDLSVMLLDDSGAVINGVYYRQGETIEGGESSGKTIDSVDVSRGLVRFVGGRLGRLPVREAKASQGPSRSENDGSSNSLQAGQ